MAVALPTDPEARFAMLIATDAEFRDAWNELLADPAFQRSYDAIGAGAPLTVDRPGVAYMLAGGGDPSNTDPFAMAPAEGEDWIITPAHVMLLSPGGFDAADFSTTPKQDEPYIMWDGTPYEHLMVPVVPFTASLPPGVLHWIVLIGLGFFGGFGPRGGSRVRR